MGAHKKLDTGFTKMTNALPREHRNFHVPKQHRQSETEILKVDIIGAAVAETWYAQAIQYLFQFWRTMVVVCASNIKATNASPNDVVIYSRETWRSKLYFTHSSWINWLLAFWPFFFTHSNLLNESIFLIVNLWDSNSLDVDTLKKW